MNKPVTEPMLQALSEERGSRRVTMADIEGSIASEHYFTAAEAAGYPGTDPHPLELLTFCVLVLKNGFTVTGQSACADPKSYDKEIGERLARAHAVNQIWPLMGFLLREEMHREGQLLASRAFSEPHGADVFIGTKVIHARPMNRLTYNGLRGWDLPAGERGEDEGYLVEYTDRVETPQHVAGFLGYVSWSPKDVFERAYKKVEKAGA